MTHDVSDDEIWNGLRRRFAAGERLISRPARPGETSLHLAKPVRRPTRLRVAGAGSLIAVGAVIVLVAVVLGPGRGRPALASASPNGSPTAIPTPSATAGQTLTATQDGLSLTTRLDRTSVEPGGKVTIDVTVHNGRTTGVIYFAPCDGAAEMNTSLPLPLDPIGRTWTGIEADLKSAALGQDSMPGDSPDQIPASIESVSCDTDHLQRRLGPGQTIESTLVWSAELVGGVPALPGDVSFTIALMGPSGYPAVYTGRVGIAYGIMVPVDDKLHVAGHIRIVGQPPKLLSKGQAVDAALADPAFARWLAEQPERTWSVVNFVLQNYGATAILPAGPNWMLEVFREKGVPRNLAMAFVDPFTGAVQLNFCESPCAR